MATWNFVLRAKHHGSGSAAHVPVRFEREGTGWVASSKVDDDGVALRLQTASSSLKAVIESISYGLQTWHRAKDDTDLEELRRQILEHEREHPEAYWA